MNKRARARVTLSDEEARAVGAGRFVRVRLPEPLWMPDGNLATSVVVGRYEGTLRAYVNLCRHHPNPLDENGGAILSADAKHLLCSTHGALFRAGDGLCVSGPCMGAALFPARAALELDVVVVEVP